MKRRSFVVRIWLTDEGKLHGQLTDPLSGWRQPFQDANQLWTLMQHFLTELPQEHRSPPPEDDLSTNI